MSGKTVDTICKRTWIKGTRQLDNLVQAIAIALCTVMPNAGLVVNNLGCAVAADIPAVAPRPDEPTPTLAPDPEPLDLKALQPGNTPAYLVTANSISLTQLTIPSLWWLRDQVADEEAYGSKLLENWLAYPNTGNRPGRVDLVVNRQFWSLLDYIDRYAFIHVFGKEAREYGYNVRVFDGRATLLGASTCDFSTINIDALQNSQLSERSRQRDRELHTTTSSLPPQPTDTIPCSILLDSSGKAGLRGGSNQLPGAGAAKGLGTLQR